MSRRSQSLAKPSAGLALGMVLIAGACGYAKRDEVESQMAQLRSEIQANESSITAVSGRVDQLETRTAALERDLRALRDEFNVAITELKNQLAFDVPVHFEFAQADVRPADQAVLDRFASVVKEYYPNAVVTVEGFTDPAGSAAYNRRLGMARAEAVKTYLSTNAGIDASALRTVSYGESADRLVSPRATKDDPGAMLNRRVTLVIDYSGTAAARPTTD